MSRLSADGGVARQLCHAGAVVDSTRRTGVFGHGDDGNLPGNVIRVHGCRQALRSG